MIHTEQIEKLVKETVQYTVAPCIKCNNDIYAGEGIEHVKDGDGNRIDIELFNKEPVRNSISYLSSGGKCHKCGNICSEDYGKWKSQAAFIWNKNNDIATLITLQEVNIKLAKDEIKRLSDLKNK